jgi:hypothetical protein
MVHVPFADAPSATVQASQGPLQALSQHTPSTQKPETHSGALAQVCPFFFLQPPAPSHDAEPEHTGVEFKSSAHAAVGVVHVPVVQAKHVVVQLSKQQTPSTQNPDAH